MPLWKTLKMSDPGQANVNVNINFDNITGQYVCRICNARYQKHRKMVYHLRYECGVLFLCPCGSKLRQKGTLMQHIKMKHPQEIEFYKRSFTLIYRNNIPVNS